MNRKPKPPSSRGELNVALNALVKDGSILRYDVQTGGKDAATIEVAIDSGADQVEVVRRVREALPDAFSAAQVRTVAG